MRSEESDKFGTPEEQRHAQIQKSAYFLSAHRRQEGLPPNPDEDWLNAEWIGDNLDVYNKFDQDVRLAIHRTVPIARLIGAFTKLSLDAAARATIAERLSAEVVFLERGDIENAFANAKTFGGLMLSLVASIRRGALSGSEKLDAILFGGRAQHRKGAPRGWEN